MTTESAAPPYITSFRGPYRFLSSFAEMPFTYPLALTGMSQWPTREHCFQACKAMTADDQAWVASAGPAGEAKRRGRQIPARPDWDEIKRTTMLQLALTQFILPYGRDLLLSTGDAILVEGNTWGDWTWGAVPPDQLLSRSQPIPQLPVWIGPGDPLVGHNWLGRILMMVRDVMAPEGLR